MTSNDDQMYKCSDCKTRLNMESRTLTCLHSFCETCVNKKVKGETSDNIQCPQCDEIDKFEKLTLSPILASHLKSQRIETTQWKCDLCLENRNGSIATNWCKDCDKFFCSRCNKFHSKLPAKLHNSIELTLIGKLEIIEAMKTDMCKIHNKVEDLYCDRCNLCLCGTCYTRHVEESPQCSSSQIPLKEVALMKQKLEGPTLLKEINDLEKTLLQKKKKSQIYSDELERRCGMKCMDLWQTYENVVKELREKKKQPCEELQRVTKQQVEKLQKFRDETESLLRKLEGWRNNLCYLLKKEQKDKDIVFGVESVAREFGSLFAEIDQKISEPVRGMQMQLKSSPYWVQFLRGLQNGKIGSGSLDYVDEFIQLENKWNLPRSNKRRLISSILVSNKDNHIFLADYLNFSIIELKESGEFVSELILSDEGEQFHPREMFFSFSEGLGVNCGLWKKERLFFLEREKSFPFLRTRKIINKKPQNFSSFSVCQIKKSILFSNKRKLQIDFYTEKGEYMKTIDTGRSSNDGWPLIRADHSTGRFWGAIPNTRKIYCFSENGQKLESFEIEEKFLNFSINESGEIFFCNSEEIFAFFPDIKLQKKLHKFQQESENIPSIFVTSEKIYVCLEIDEKYFIKIFKFME